MLPFKLNIFSSTFTSYYLFGMQFLQTSIMNKIFYGVHINTFGGGSYPGSPGSSQSDYFGFTGRWPVTNRTEGNYKRQFSVLLV